ncbi:LegC family aminotransferase [Nitrospinaceae bacterium]|nr:LegC family aminotransferase [Nitrospinaceae bacterium]
MNSSIKPDLIIKAIKNCLPKNISAPTPLHQPCFGGKEWEYLKDCLDSGWVSSVGKYVDDFEDGLQNTTGSKYAVAVVNGTSALHLCLQLCDVKDDDEIIVPTLAFVAVANAISYCNAVPHFVDCSDETLGVDPTSLEPYLEQISEIKNGECFNKSSGRRIKALIAVHTFGHPVDLDAVLRVCQRFHIDLIEDAAESLGSTYKGVHTGCYGKVSALSFNGNKIITTGGGGAILTQDKDLARLAKHLSTTAKRPHPWQTSHDTKGYNYRLPNLNAALGCAQLEQLPEFVRQKRRLATKYKKEFDNYSGIKFYQEPEFAKSNYWLNALLLNQEYHGELENLLKATNENQIMTRPAWNLLHTLPMFEDCPRSGLETAESLATRLLNLPSSPILGASYV